MHIHSYLLDNEMLLYSEARQAIYRLNPSASFLWCCHEEGLSEKQMVVELTEAFPIDEVQAKRDLTATLSEWQLLGLLSETEEPNSAGRKEIDGPEEASEPLIDTGRFDARPDCVIRHYQVLGQTVEIRYSDEALFKTAGIALNSLHIDITAAIQHRFMVASAENEFVVMYDNKLVERCCEEESLAPLVLAQVVSRTYLDTPCLLGLHAAAVGKNGHCIVMPAESGSGKSTLTAAMAASGFDYYTDELVLIMNGTHRLMTASVGMGIKPGSWEVLRGYYPGLEQCPIHPRPDGKQVRYLTAPIQSSELLEANNPVRALVFPVYTSGHSACLTPVSTADAMCRLTAAGYDVDGGLSRETVEELIDWISSLDCYELAFDDLAEAVAIVGEVLA